MARVFPATNGLPTHERLGSPFFGSLPVDCLLLFLLWVPKLWQECLKCRVTFIKEQLVLEISIPLTRIATPFVTIPRSQNKCPCALGGSLNLLLKCDLMCRPCVIVFHFLCATCNRLHDTYQMEKVKKKEA
jgi:hypothetical protein